MLMREIHIYSLGGFMKKIFIFLVVLLIAGVAIMVLKEYKNENDVPVINDITQASTTEDSKKENNKTEESEKIYAVWLTYSEIGSLVKGKSAEEYRETLETVFKNLTGNKINTVFYQCRAFCDSFYASDIFPVSKYITADSKALTFDPFEMFSEMAENYGISVHCWVNPYRISYDKEYKNLPKNSPARRLYKEDKSTLLICENGIFLNPAHAESRKLVFEGIRELLNKYKVQGIHFDDYFYPEAEEINDKKLYKEYKNQGGTLPLEEWRRENVNALISGVYALVKSYGDDMIFSISPSADVEKCRNVLYADVGKWCREEGFADYIIPQIYFGFENEKMPFSDVLKEWENIASKGNTELVCGLGVYKCGETDLNAGTGKNEWTENVNILSRQYEQMEKSQLWQGFALFSYSYCFGENVTEISKKEIKKLLYMVE